MKSHGFFVYCSPPNSPFPSVKELCRGHATGLSWLQTPNCQSLLFPNTHIFAGEISGSLFVSDQQSLYTRFNFGRVRTGRPSFSYIESRGQNITIAETHKIHVSVGWDGNSFPKGRVTVF